MNFITDDDPNPRVLDPAHQPLADALGALERQARAPGKPSVAAEAQVVLDLLRAPDALPHPGDELDGALYEDREALSALWRRTAEALVTIIERDDRVETLRDASVALLQHTTELDWATKGLPQTRLLTHLLGRARQPERPLTLPMLALLKLVMPDDSYALKLVVQRFRGSGGDDPIRVAHLVELVALWPRLADSSSGGLFLKTALASLLGDLPPDDLAPRLLAMAETIRSERQSHRFARLPDTFLRREPYRRPPLLDPMLHMLCAVAEQPAPDAAALRDPTARLGLIIAAWPALHLELGDVGRQDLPSRHVFLGSVHEDPMGDHLSELWDALWSDLGEGAVSDAALLETIEATIRARRDDPQAAEALSELLAHVAPRAALFDARNLRRLLRAIDALPPVYGRPILDAHLELHEAAPLWHTWADERFQEKILALLAAGFGELEVHEAVRALDALMEDAADWQPHQLRALGAWPGALLDVHEQHPDLDHVLVELTCLIPSSQAEPAMLTILHRTPIARTQALILGWLADHGTPHTAGELHRWSAQPPQRDDRTLKKAVGQAIAGITARAGQSGGLSVMDARQGALSYAPEPIEPIEPPSHALIPAPDHALQQGFEPGALLLPVLAIVGLAVATLVVYVLGTVFL